MFITSSILKDPRVSYCNVSILGDDQIIISFPYKENLESFLGLKETFKEYFSSISTWERGVQSSKRFIWINIFGSPLEF